MNELFLLDKKIDLHNGTNYPEWHTLRVVKPSQLTIEGEVPETISLSISQRANKQDKGVSIVVSFDLTPTETKDLILALQYAIKKEEPDMPTPINREGMFQTLPTPNFSGSHTVLDKAKDLIYGDRVNDYGKTSDNFKNICVGWEIIFKDGFTPERVGLAMAWLKICRASNDNCEKEDSLVDCCGYIGCVEKIKKNL